MADIFIKWLDSTDSTNARMSAEKDNLGDMSVIAAMEQTAGRGQRGNSWESSKGENLTFSILLKPKDIHLQEQFSVSEAVAVGTADYLATKGIEAKIKWPNDIYVADKKICGILIEHHASGDNLSASIVGVGLNVNQCKFVSDAPNPTSMKLLTGIEFNVKDELPLLLEFILTRYSCINQGERRFYNRTSLDGKFLEMLYRRGEWHYFEEMPQGNRIRARILGTDNSACLQLEHENGIVKSYAFKEIKYIL